MQKFGISTPPRVEAAHRASGRPSRRCRSFPNFFLRELMAWYVALGVLGSLAALFPWELGDKADPFAPAPAGHPARVVFSGALLHAEADPEPRVVIEGELLGLLGFGLLVAFWVLLPFWATNRPGDANQVGHRGGVALIAYLATFSALGYWR